MAPPGSDRPGPPLWPGDRLGLTTADGLNPYSRGRKPCAIGYGRRTRHASSGRLLDGRVAISILRRIGPEAVGVFRLECESGTRIPDHPPAGAPQEKLLEVLHSSGDARPA